MSCSRTQHTDSREYRLVTLQSPKVSEYDKEMQQSHTADQPMAPPGRDTQRIQSQYIRKTKSKATKSNTLSTEPLRFSRVLHYMVG